MANKRYDEFTPGTPSGARLILHADPSDGSLENADIDTLFAQNPPKIVPMSVLVNANNSGSNPEDVGVMTVPANALANNGDYILFEAYMRTLTASGTKTMTIRVAGINNGSYGGTQAGMYRFKLTICRINSTTCFVESIVTRDNGFIGSSTSEAHAWTASNANDVGMRITAGAANDILTWWTSLRINTP